MLLGDFIVKFVTSTEQNVTKNLIAISHMNKKMPHLNLST